MSVDFKIGDDVYIADFGAVTVWETCPHCLGTRVMKAVLANGDEHSCECGNCRRGYEGSTGRVSYYSQSAKTEIGTISGISDQIERGVSIREYTVQASYTRRVKDVFATREEAQVRGDELAAEWNAKEKERISGKYKDTKSWAWNVSYHKNCLKRAEREISYHTSKLNEAKTHVKEEKKSA